VLDAIPATWVVLTRVPDPAARAALQRDLVERFPSVSAVDLARIEAAVRQVVGTVAEAVRFMTLFSVLAGLLILVAALWASRRQRLREAVLLRTLGARAGTLRAMHLAEYVCLGGLGGLAGTALAAAAGWAVVTRGFGLPYRAPVGSLALLALATGVVSVLVGALAGGRAMRRPPLEVLRGLEE
jgi:putative ABC transport system permease protein